MIEVRGLCLIAGTRVLIDHATFTAHSGELLAIVGRNGAGKTTLLRAIAGIDRAHGSITISGTSVADMPPSRRASELAFVAADEVFADRLTVREVVAMGRYAQRAWWDWREFAADKVAVDQALAAVGMSEFAPRAFQTLSSGERQRVWIALALAQESRALLLDEPTSHLDIRVARDILGLLRAQAREGKAVVCALHDLNEAAEFAHRVMLLGEGAILALDRPTHVLTGELLKQAFGIDMQQLRLPDGTLRVYGSSLGARR